MMGAVLRDQLRESMLRHESYLVIDIDDHIQHLMKCSTRLSLAVSLLRHVVAKYSKDRPEPQETEALATELLQ